jgi:hypothetical protein
LFCKANSDGWLLEKGKKLRMQDETAIRLFKTRFKTKTQPFAAYVLYFASLRETAFLAKAQKLRRKPQRIE